CGQGTYLLTF
nr:immunoglobulin light chain junction region [Macaca mulatta]MOV84232.1 immunoglobulin light chain junction region [Macaca mulatta]